MYVRVDVCVRVCIRNWEPQTVNVRALGGVSCVFACLVLGAGDSERMCGLELGSFILCIYECMCSACLSVGGQIGKKLT